MSEEIKTFEQRRADLNDRKVALSQKKKELNDIVKADEQKKKNYYLMGIGATVLGFIIMSFSVIIGFIVAALGVGFIVLLKKKGEILLKDNSVELKTIIQAETKSIAADEAAILIDEEAERKRKEEEERKQKEEELERQRGQIESEEKGIYGKDCDFSAKSIVNRKENLEKIEGYFEVDASLSVDEKVALINSAKESVKDIVASSNVNDIMEALDGITFVLSVDVKQSFVKRIADIRTALANLIKMEELLGSEIDNFDSNSNALEKRVARIAGLQKKYNVDSSLSAEEQTSKIKTGIKEEEERKRRAEELKQKATQIEKEIEAIYGVVEAKFGYVSKLLLEGKMKKVEEFETFFGVDGSLDVDKKIALIQAFYEKIKALGFSEPTIAKAKVAFVNHAESLGVATNLKFDDMLVRIKG